MIGPLNFKAQALDNTSPDHYQIGNECLRDGDLRRRRQVTNMISVVAREGAQFLKADGAELIVDGSRFLVQVYSEQLDRVGRRAPILCCGEYDRIDDLRTGSAAIIQGIHGFAEKIGRTVETAHIQAIEGKLTDLKSKHGAFSRGVLLAIASLLAVAGLLLAALC